MEKLNGKRSILNSINLVKEIDWNYLRKWFSEPLGQFFRIKTLVKLYVRKVQQKTTFFYFKDRYHLSSNESDEAITAAVRAFQFENVFMWYHRLRLLHECLNTNICLRFSAERKLNTQSQESTASAGLRAAAGLPASRYCREDFITYVNLCC